MLVELRAKSQVTIPKRVVKNLGLKEGDQLEVGMKDGCIFFTPVATYPKAYVAEMEKEVAAYKKGLKEGKIKNFKTIDETLKGLRDNADS